MKFNSCNLIAKKFMFHGNVINMVAADRAESASHMPHNAVLSAVINYIITDNMGADPLFAPSDLPAQEYRFHLILIPRLFVEPGAEIISGRSFFSQADGTAFGVMKNIIFYYPAFAPVGSCHAWLICCGRCPGACRLGNFKSPQSNIVDACFIWIKTAFSDVNFRQFFIGVFPLEICIDHRLLFSHLCIPLVYRVLRVQQRLRMFGPGRIDSIFPAYRSFDLFQGFCLIERFSI